MRRGAARGDLGGDVGARAEAGIERSLPREGVERGGVGVYPVRLEDGIAVPGQAEPVEICEDGIDMFGARAAGVDIVDAHDEAPIGVARGVMREDRGIGVAEMEFSRGAGSETRDDRIGRCQRHGVSSGIF